MKEIRPAWHRLWSVIRNDRPTVLLILAFATLRGAFSLVLPLGFQALIGQLMGGRLSTSWWVLFALVLIFSGLMILFGLVQMRLSEWFQQRLFVRTAYFFERATELGLPTESREPSHRFFDAVTLQRSSQSFSSMFRPLCCSCSLVFFYSSFMTSPLWGRH